MYKELNKLEINKSWLTVELHRSFIFKNWYCKTISVGHTLREELMYAVADFIYGMKTVPIVEELVSVSSWVK
jgi:hypothetical protein